MNQMEDDYPLLGDLREAYLAAGGEQEDWDDLVHGLHHSQAALEWTDTSMIDHSKRLEDLGVKSLAAGNLIEYEVRETDHGAPTGVAIGLIKSYRCSKSQVSLEIKHVTSTDSQFNDWAAYHINESGEFHLHLCKKPPGSCVAMPTSKKVGWLHVARFRLTTYVGALSPVFDTDAILDTLRERVEVLIEAFSPEEPPRFELRPRGDGEEVASAGVGGKRKADQKARDAAKKALSAAVPKFGDVKKKKIPEPEAPDRRRKKDEVEKAGGKPAESVKAQQAAHQGARALMGGHPMVLVEAKEKPEGKQNYGGRQPWLEGLSGDEDPDQPDDRGREPRRRVGGAGPPGGGDDDDDDDEDDKKDDRPRRVEKRKRGSSESSRRKKKKDKREAAEKPPPSRGAHIFPSGEKGKRRRGGPGGGPSSSPDHSGEGRRNKEGKKVAKKKKDKDRGRRRRRRSSESSSRSRTGSDSQGEFYGKDSSRYESLAEKARKKPGMLLKSGLAQMAKYLTIRTGGTEEEASRSWRDQRVGAYLNQVLFAQHPQEKLGMRNVRELITLGEAIDFLMEGQFAAAGDVLMQRMKAVESSVTDGWQLASHQELIPPAKATLSTNLEKSWVAKQALQAKKLEESIKAKKG